MQIQFLGGASHVGATCQLVTTGSTHLLVDAGIRVGAADALPDLAALDGVSLDAILITHAHADHIGALPLVHAQHPATPIYASPATCCLIEVMLGDAVRVMSRRAAEELDFPLYDDALVAATLQMLRPLRPGAQRLPGIDDLVIHAQRAGHIAGAVSLGLEAPDGRLVISGDVSVTPQRTILGAQIPDPHHPDLLVLEATYGARLHPNRTVEERRLAEAVATVVDGGGHCLLPAFALGRAQEIISILRAAQRDGHIPPFPIAVDGLVRAVCAAYAAIPNALTPGLRRHILAGGRPFFGQTVQPIETPTQRERVLAGPPGAIVASSGMLTGGPSVWYAERLVGDARSAVLFSGYQDEEAPGRKLLDLLDTPAAERRMRLGERVVPVACAIGRYNLSAHADGDELASIVRALTPKGVALVHGDGEARAALAAKLDGLTNVMLPQDGQTLPVRTTRRRTPIQHALPEADCPAPIGGDAPLDGRSLERLWSALRDGSGTQALHVRTLAQAWAGAETTDDLMTTLEALLDAGTPHFKPLPGAPGLWRLLAATEVRRAQAALSGGMQETRRGQRVDQAGIQAIVDRHLGHVPDLYQRSIDPATGAVTLRYFFPDMARERDADAIATIASEAGVSVALSPEAHQGELAATARAVLPDGLSAQRSPAIRRESRVVEVACSGEADAAAVTDAQQRFMQQTGWTLLLTGLSHATTLAQTPADARGSYRPHARTPRMEVNAALELIRRRLQDEVAPLKIGANQQAGILTVRFAFPTVARTRYAATLTKLASETGWTVQVWPQANQQALLQAATQAIPADLTLLGTPAIQETRHEVVLRVRGVATEAALAAARTAFAERTGYALVVQGATVADA